MGFEIALWSFWSFAGFCVRSVSGTPKNAWVIRRLGKYLRPDAWTQLSGAFRGPRRGSSTAEESLDVPGQVCITTTPSRRSTVILCFQVTDPMRVRARQLHRLDAR
jgi:hypothetical protein